MGYLLDIVLSKKVVACTSDRVLTLVLTIYGSTARRCELIVGFAVWLVAGVAPMALTACRALSATGAAEERRTLRPRLGLASGHGSGRQSVDSVADHQAGSRCRKPACGAARECAGQHTAAEVERLLRAADDAETAANQPCLSAEEQHRVIHDAEALAGGEAGVPAKSSRVVRTLQSK